MDRLISLRTTLVHSVTVCCALALFALLAPTNQAQTALRMAVADPHSASHSRAAVRPRSVSNPSVWQAQRIASGSDGSTRVLWENVSEQAALWTVNTAGQIAVNGQSGPYSGWTPRAVAVGPDGVTHALWSNSGGQIALWTLNSANQLAGQYQYGPYSGWSVVDMSVGSDSNTRLLWQNVSGQAALWTVNQAGSLVTNYQYGPYAGWSPVEVGATPDGNTRLLWSNASGQAALWALNRQGQFVSNYQYGPYSGWTAQALAVGSDGNTRLLWDNTGGQAALWILNGQGQFIANYQYGPYSGWTAQALSVDGGNNVHVLWDNVSGQAALWTLNGQGQIAGNYQYGPYTFSSSGGGSTNYSPDPDSTYFASLSTTMNNYGWQVNGSFTLTSSQTFVFRFVSDYNAQAAILTSDQYYAFEHQQPFSGYGLFDNQFGYHSVTLGPGTYAVGVRSNVQGSNTVQFELDLPTNINGWYRNDNYATGDDYLQPGARRWQKFTVQVGIRYLIDGDNSGLNSYVIPAAQLDNFSNGRQFTYYTDYSSDSGDTAQYGFSELKLPTGDYYLAQYNPTSIAKSFTYVLERWLPQPGTSGTL